MNYKFVILGDGDSISMQSFYDVMTLENVTYIPDMYKCLNSISRFFFKIHVTPKINKLVSLPLKNQWLSYILKKYNIKNSDNMCFILSNFWIKSDELGAIEYIKHNYPMAKIVWYLRDIVKTLQTISQKKPLNIPEIKNKLDLILSFDHHDCEQYGFDYYPLVFSAYHGINTTQTDSDVYFLGYAKDRLETIYAVYDECQRYGLKCDFHIVGVPNKKQRYTDSIIYNKLLSYQDNLQHILHTKCLLEVMQGGGEGYTQRVCEAVCFDKKLLTNNPRIKEEPFYKEDLISQFMDVTEIDTDFLKNIPSTMVVDFKFKNNFSPTRLLHYIENKLTSK